MMRVGVLVTAAPSPSHAALLAPAGLGAQRRAFRPLCRSTHGAQGSDIAGFISTSNAGRSNAAEGAQPQTDATVDAPPKRGRGRPPGIPAWNKGIAISEAHRKRISLKLQQKWKDPEFKRSVSAGLAGKSAWNAGQAHPPETRAKMAEAKLGKRQPLATRKLIAAANTGRSLSEDARAKVGDRFRGQPKSPEHRSKLASMARRRHAAARVLRAVEAVYSAASAAQPAAGSAAGPPQRVPASGGAMASAGGAGSSPPAGSPAGLGSGAAPPGAAAPNLGAVRAAAYSMGLTGLSSGSGKRLSRTQILNTFKAELREYRTLQEELSTWTAAFCEKNNRKPNLVDVQRTGIPWLIDKFKQYVVLRDRLFSDTSVLRGKLQESIPDPEALRGAGGTGSPALAAPSGAGALGPTNANGLSATARSAMASRFAAVMDYKMKRAATAEGGPAQPTAAAAPAAPAAAAESVNVAVAGAAAAAPAAEATEQPAAARMVSSQAPPRVRMAMQAALEYRQQRAQATKAAAEQAAAAARSAASTKEATASAAAAAAAAVASSTALGAPTSSQGATALPWAEQTPAVAVAAVEPASAAGPAADPAQSSAGEALAPPVLAAVEACVPLQAA